MSEAEEFPSAVVITSEGECVVTPRADLVESETVTVTESQES